MVVSVTAATTQGVKIEEEELENINEACQMNMDLMNAKLKIFQYVESRMSFIAPNVSIVVGASTAAKIMGVAGGLTNLSKMPSCNVLLLGSQKRVLSGFSTASTQVLPHTGFIYHSELVQVRIFVYCFFCMFGGLTRLGKQRNKLHAIQGKYVGVWKDHKIYFTDNEMYM